MELLNEQELQKISEKNWIQYGLAPNGVNQLSNTFQARKSEAREEKRAIHNTLKSEKAALKESVKGQFGTELTKVLNRKTQKIWL